jgi:hypothetical protein
VSNERSRNRLLRVVGAAIRVAPRDRSVLIVFLSGYGGNCPTFPGAHELFVKIIAHARRESLVEKSIPRPVKGVFRDSLKQGRQVHLYSGTPGRTVWAQ